MSIIKDCRTNRSSRLDRPFRQIFLGSYNCKIFDLVGKETPDVEDGIENLGRKLGANSMTRPYAFEKHSFISDHGTGLFHNHIIEEKLEIIQNIIGLGLIININ